MALPYALLGFLNYSPMTGYDLKKVLQDSVKFFWLAQTSQIYRELNSLEEKGYIVSTIKPSDKGPNRREYQITSSGVKLLQEWLTKSRKDEFMRNEFMIWLLFSSQLGKDELKKQLQIKLQEYKKEYQMLQNVEEKIKDYTKLYDKKEENYYWKIVLSRGLYDVKAKIRWTEDTLNEINNTIE